MYGAAVIIEGNIYVAGGSLDRAVLMSAEFYNVENDIWNRLFARDRVASSKYLLSQGFLLYRDLANKYPEAA